MELKPVMQVKQPNYPQKGQIDDKALIQRVPLRWSRGAAKIALSALAAVSLAGCRFDGQRGSDTNVFTGFFNALFPTPTPYEHLLAGDIMPYPVSVAPLFLHGEGRGVYDDNAETQPAFLTEEDALNIINKVASEYGLEFSAENTPVYTGVRQPQTNTSGEVQNSAEQSYISFSPDFADSRVVIEFVSVEDVKTWRQNTPDGTAEVYDVLDAAAQLSEALDFAWPYDNGDYTIGVLYDPCAFLEGSDGQMRSISEYLLEKQARDFFEWLRQQGII